MSSNTRSTFSSTSQSPSYASCDGRYKREAHDEYLEHDLQRHRVVLHAEKFLEVVFRTPASWEDDPSLSRLLAVVTAHEDFRKALNDFLLAAKGPTTEDGLYPVIISLYVVVFNLLDQCDPLPGSNETHDKDSSMLDLVHVIETKDTNIAMCQSDHDFRVLHKGVDPCPTEQASTPTAEYASATATSTKRKRPNDDVDGSISDTASPSSTRTQDWENSREQQRINLQCARYAMKHLSDVVLRSHCIVTLFDRDRFQLQYFDRSVIAVSTAVALSTEQGQKLFVLMVYSLRRLSAEDLGLRSVVQDSWTLYTDYQLASNHTEENGAQDWRRIFFDRRMDIENEEYTLKDIVHREPGLISRGTCVVEAIRTSDEQRCVVKFSFPPRTRVAEMDHIRRARQCAKSDAKHAWVLNHLPNMIASRDVVIDGDCVQARIRDFLNGAEYVDGKKYQYEDRCLRICVSEELHAITSLTSQRDVAQVFLDILQTHKWLYDVPRILHRDLSMSNIMFRMDKDGNVYGVPNDFDLASLLSQLEAERGSTSLWRTGTPPYMAIDLQKPYNPHAHHLYRHDLESLFYVLVMFVCRYEYKESDRRYVLREKPPFDDWFDSTKSLALLQCHKVAFFHDTEIEDIKSRIAPGFKDFERWVLSLCNDIGEAFRKRRAAKSGKSAFSMYAMDEEMLEAVKAGVLAAPVERPVVEVDEETLGGLFTYWTFYKRMRRFGGQLLDVRRSGLGLPSL